jgi:hypothetical protein
MRGQTLTLTLLFLAACTDGTSQKDAACPTAEIDHTALTWVDVPVGTGSDQDLVLTNECAGEDELTIDTELSGATFAVTPTSWTLGEGESVTLTVTWTPDDTAADNGTLQLVTSDPDRPEIAVTLSGTPLMDADGDGSLIGDDCDDSDPDTYPGAPEIWYDGVDQGCDGGSDYDRDADGRDAESYGGTDCDDGNPEVYPGAADEWYDGVDADCAGDDDYDADLDGYGGGDGGADCDDADASIHPGVPDTPYDGLDADCSGSDYDADGDGSDSDQYGGDDCDDNVDSIHPGATEGWYDGVDSDCGGDSDFDQDGDGADSSSWGGTDCDDTTATTHVGAVEAYYDGVDADCDGASDYDYDHDGYDSAGYGGTDCDDAASAVNPGASEVWYDGLDSDCDGASDYDEDGDGYDSDSYGGTDCDDATTTAHPGATETWYDGIDGDCDGASDYDQDADGYEVFPTGDDCDDTDAATTEGTAEVQNGLDDDCDGYVDEDFLAAGDVVITEVMANPSAVSDTVGEWFEVHNTTEYPVNMNGWIVYSDDGGYFTISSSLPIDPDGYAVLGVEDDPTLNGGVTVDYQYSRFSFGLSDTGDSIFLVSGSTTIAELSWTSSWPTTSGYAMMLDDDHESTTDSLAVGYWCRARETYGDGTDFGSPGDGNGNCMLDDDGDGSQSLDCNDDDATIHYGYAELIDGVDQNCNGYIDEPEYAVADLPYVDGPAAGRSFQAAGIADYDDDGRTEIAAVDVIRNEWYFLSGTSYASWAGLVTTYDEAGFTASGTGTGYVAGAQGSADLNGDGIEDLVYANTSTGSAGFSIHYGPMTGFGFTLTPDVRMGRTESQSATTIDVEHDFNGDGDVDLVYGNGYSTLEPPSYYYYYTGSLAIFQQSDLTAGTLAYSDASVVFTGSSSSYYDYVGYKYAAGDLNGDGYDDLAVSGYYTIYTWMGDGFATTGQNEMATEATASITTSYATDIALHDVDQDGTIDLVANAGSTISYYYDAGALSGTVATLDADAVYDPPDYYGSAGWSLKLLDGEMDADGDGVSEMGVYADSYYFSEPIFAWFGADAFADGELTGDEAALSLTIESVSSSYLKSFVGDLDSDGTDEAILTDSAHSSASGTSGEIIVVEP